MTLANARYSVALLLTNLVTSTKRRSKGNFAPFFCKKISLDTLLLRFSQKAGFLRVARFARNNKDINVTTAFFGKPVLFCFKYVYLKKIVIFEI